MVESHSHHSLARFYSLFTVYLEKNADKKKQNKVVTERQRLKIYKQFTCKKSVKALNRMKNNSNQKKKTTNNQI